MSLPTVLSIAGSDPSGGAGIQADCKTIHALGGYALSVATALTAQNSQGVQGVYPVSNEAFNAQLESLFVDYQIDAIKIGMLADAGKIDILKGFLRRYPDIPAVLDPVLISSSGTRLLKTDAVESLIEKLLPRVTLITPNLPEAQFLLKQAGCSKELNTGNDFQAPVFAEMGVQNLLVKGGHQTGEEASDFLLQELQAKWQLSCFSKPRLKVQHSHGTGCTLSSAIATFLAQNLTLSAAVKQAKEYLHQALSLSELAQPHYRHIPEAAQKKGGVNHFLVGKRPN